MPHAYTSPSKVTAIECVSPQDAFMTILSLKNGISVSLATFELIHEIPHYPNEFEPKTNKFFSLLIANK